jgi:hypothetical protein
VATTRTAPPRAFVLTQRVNVSACAFLTIGFAAGQLHNASSPGHSSGLFMLFWFALFPASVLSLLFAALCWRTHRWRALIAPLLLLPAFTFDLWLLPIGWTMRDHFFHRDVAALEALVRELPTTPWTGVRDVDLSVIEPHRRRCCTHAIAYRDSTGMRVLFTVGRAAPYGYSETAAQTAQRLLAPSAPLPGTWRPELQRAPTPNPVP